MGETRALKEHLEENGLLDPNQHGFRNGMGTQTNLLQMWESIMDKLEKEGALVEFWSFDLTKAFDLLDHNQVLNLLKKAGVTGKFGMCIQDWLTGRSQYVEAEKIKSKTVNVGKSCVQGSVLGPTLWLIYVQSLMDELRKAGVDYHGYADDIAIIKIIKTLKDKEDFEKILKILQDWAEKFGMEWSPLKTQRLVLKYKGCIEPHEPFEIMFGGQIIEPLDSTAESLGLLISKNCVFGAHIKRITDRFKSITCNVRRNFINKSPETMAKIYNVYMQSRLDYCSPVYFPGKESLIKSIESAVDSFWKLSTKGEPPENFMSPGLRLIFTDLVLIHKIANGNSVIKYEEIFKIKQQVSPKEIGEQTVLFVKDRVILRGNQIVIPKFRLQVARHRFSFRTRRYWNIVPDELKSLKLSNFKEKLKKHLLKNKQKFLNLSRTYNIVGEVEKKKVKKKKVFQKNTKWYRTNRLGDNLTGNVRGNSHPAINKKLTVKKNVKRTN